MRKLFLISLLLPFLSNAKTKKPSAFDQWTLKFAVHGLVDPINPCVQLGVEYKPVWNIGLQVEVANKAGLRYSFDEKRNIQYSKLKARGVWYYFEKERLNMYAGFDFLYVPKSYDLLGGNYSRDQYYSFSSASVHRKTVGIFLVDGLTLKRGRSFRMDLDINAGLRITNIHYSNIQNLQPAQPPKDYLFYVPTDYIEGIHYYPHVGIGFRLGYVLHSKTISH